MKKNISSRSRIIRREIDRMFSNKKTIAKTDLLQILYKMKYNLSPEISIYYLNNLDEESKSFVTGCPLPYSYIDLRTHGNSKFRRLFHSEINWITMLICTFSKEINLFLNYEKQFEREFLLGNYNNSLEIINKIDSEICVSHWSLEKRLLLAEYFPEGQSKSKLFELIKSDAERLVKVNSSYQSTRFDEQLPPNRYDDIIEKFASKQKNLELSNYFLFKLNYFNNLRIEQPEIALFLESNLSIIDRYQIFFQISLSLICDKTPNKTYLDSLVPCLLSTSKVIEDGRLLNMLIYSGIEHKELKQTDINSYAQILEFFYSDNFEDCYKFSLEFLCSTPYYIEVAELLVKSSIILRKKCPKISENDSLINRIIICLYSIYTKNSDYELSIYNLSKIAKSISSPIWCYQLIDVINCEQSFVYDNYSFNLHKTLSFFTVSPELSLHISNEENLSSFIEIFKPFKNIYKSISGKQKIPNQDIVLNSEMGFFSKINIVKSLSLQGKYEVALDFLNEICKKESYSELLKIPYINLDIVKMKIHFRYKLNDLENAMELLCKSVVTNDKLHFAFNNNEVLSDVIDSNDLNIHENICTPILASLYKEKINDIWIVYDNFMYSNNLKFPHELFDNKLFDIDFLKYFLKNVCIQDIYDSSIDFNSSDELDNERIKICNYLSIIDSEKKELYINEITEIETRALIKKGIKEIDESKIFVDTIGIWREIESDIKERFTRGKELLKMSAAEIDCLLEMSSSVLVFFLPKKDEEGSIIKFDNSQDRHEGIVNQPHFISFKEMFLLIRDRFISSNEFGLDSYISMRIRHGTLLGQIRSIFERYNLITKKSSSTKQYIENEYWLSKINSNRSVPNISEKLNHFSEKIDLMSEEIKNSFLQIKTEEKNSNGLFDCKFDDEELVRLYDQKFYSIEDHKVFFETAIDCLWQRTEYNLNAIREKFTNEFSNNTLQYLEDLFSSIEKFKKTDSIDTNEFLRDITACKTDTTNSFEKISLWFRRSYSNSINEFEMTLVTTICFSIVNKIHPQTPILSPEIVIDSDVILHGKYFTFFIDIMRNILDNIIVRSELAEPELKVQLKVKVVKGIMQISIENNVSENINLNITNQRIATTQHRIDNGNDCTLLKKEGGSGYLKIKNILSKILNRKNYILKLEQIGEDRIFRSNISFELNDLIK